MAKYIHCEECKNRIGDNAHRAGKLYESLEGIALADMYCDGSCTVKGTDGVLSATPIKKGDKCFASVLLPSKSHPQHFMQRPVMWAEQLIEIKK